MGRIERTNVVRQTATTKLKGIHPYRWIAGKFAAGGYTPGYFTPIEGNRTEWPGDGVVVYWMTDAERSRLEAFEQKLALLRDVILKQLAGIDEMARSKAAELLAD